MSFLFKNIFVVFLAGGAAVLGIEKPSSYPLSERDFSVTVLSSPCSHIRKAERYLEDKGVYEEILDDGTSESIDNLEGVSWRNFRTTTVQGNTEEVVVGAWDLPTKNTLILRKVVSTLGEKGRENFVYDGTGKLISTGSGSSHQVPFDNASAFLDGQLAQQSLHDRHVITFFRDLLGALLDQKGEKVRSQSDARGCVRIERAGRTFLFKRDHFGRVNEIVDSDGATYQIDYDALDRIVEIRALCQHSWCWSRTLSVDGAKSVTILTQDQEQLPYIMTEIRRENGLLFSKKEEMGEEAFFYEFDEKGRVLSIDHTHNGQTHLALRKSYVSFRQHDEEVQQEKTVYADQTSLIEERTTDGKRYKTWLDASGKEVLREELTPVDKNGSMRLQQKTGTRSRAIEWEFGSNKRLLSIKEGEAATQFFYDNEGRLIAKKTPLHAIFYTWDKKSLVELMSDDGTIDYQFSYDAQGRMTKITDVVVSKAVERSFDEKGRLLSDGEGRRVCSLRYGENDVLSEIRLPDGSAISYEHSGDSWRVRRGVWSAVTTEKTAHVLPMCCRKTSINHEDPQGRWVQEVSYDSLGQISGEKGEFNEEYSFSPFGSLASREGDPCVSQGDSVTCGDMRITFDKEGNSISQERDGEKKEFFYDALGRLASVRYGAIEEQYRYDGLSRLQEISLFRDGVVETCKELVWIGETEIGAIEERALSELKISDPSLQLILGIELHGALYNVDVDDHGSVTMLFDHTEPVQVYRYSAFGSFHTCNCAGERISPKSPWLYSGKRYLENSGLYDFGPRRYDPIMMRWCEKDPLGMVDGCDTRIFAKNDPVSFVDPSGLLAFPVDWDALKGSTLKAMQRIASSTWKSITLAKDQLDWFCEVRDEFENISFNMLGKKWMQLIGYNPDMSSVRVCGTGEKNPKVRLTFINGILNGTSESLYSASLVSQTHGGTPVHYVYVATNGFTGDILRAAAAQAGVLSYQVKLLAEMWKQLIVEMGGVNSGGVIHHYAHSLGATETINALKLLSPQERNMICVTTFGGSSLILEGLCKKADNYISTKDGVPILDLGGYISASFWEKPSVHFLPSDSSPLVDHLFAGKTYRKVLELLGHEFQEKYLLAAGS